MSFDWLLNTAQDRIVVRAWGNLQSQEIGIDILNGYSPVIWVRYLGRDGSNEIQCKVEMWEINNGLDYDRLQTSWTVLGMEHDATICAHLNGPEGVRGVPPYHFWLLPHYVRLDLLLHQPDSFSAAHRPTPPLGWSALRRRFHAFARAQYDEWRKQT